jgi:hypothetical protein
MNCFACQVLREENESLRKKNYQLNDRLSKLEEQMERLLERQEVRRIKILALREMLVTHFGYKLNPTIEQPVRIMAVQDEPLIQATNGDTEEITEKVHHWISYYHPHDITNCDINARVCWATIHGGKNRNWVLRKSHVDDDLHSVHVQNLPTIHNNWATSQKYTTMMVRFVAENDETDGHTILLYKRTKSTAMMTALEYFPGTMDFADELAHKHIRQGNIQRVATSSKSITIFSFQAYNNVLTGRFLEADILSDSNYEIVRKILNGEPVHADDFGYKLFPDATRETMSSPTVKQSADFHEQQRREMQNTVIYKKSVCKYLLA